MKTRQCIQFILLLLLTPVLGAYAGPETPEATVRAYFTALAKGDRTNAIRLTARFPRFDEAQVATVTDRYIRCISDLDTRRRFETVRR
jgi:hypothetical protein